MIPKKITTAQLLEHLNGIRNELLTEIHAVKFGLLIRIDALDAKVSVLDDKVDALDTKVSVLDDKVDALDTKVNSMDAKIDTMHENIIDLKTFIIDSSTQNKGLEKRVEKLEVVAGIRS